MRPKQMIRASLPLALVLMQACSASDPQHVGRQRQADGQTFTDNQWGITIWGGNGKVSQFHFEAPQSTPIATLYAQAVTSLNSQCGQDTVCRHAPIQVSLVPLNVLAPPPPTHPFALSLTQHFLDGQKQLMQLIHSQLSAESQRLSLYGATGQQENIANYLAGVLQDFNDRKRKIQSSASDTLKKEASAIVGQEMADLATTKQNTQALQALTQAYSTAAAAFQMQFSTIVEQYRAYRGLEPDTLTQLTKASTDASASTLDNMPAIQQSLLTLDASESQLPEQLVVLTTGLSHQLAQLQHGYDDAVQLYADFMKARGFQKPDATTVPIRALDDMYYYSLTRENQVRGVIAKIINGLQLRTQALLIQQADAATQPALLQAAQLAASTQFISQINDRLNQLWKSPPVSTGLQLPFLAAQYDDFVHFLQLEPMCNGSQPVPPYMQTGCNLMQPQLSRAHEYAEQTLPSTMRLDLFFMESGGIDPMRTAEVRAELQAGNVAQAVLDHDGLLRASDLPPPSNGAPDGGTADGGATQPSDGEDDL